jgi:serine/threonine protein kinase
VSKIHEANVSHNDIKPDHIALIEKHNPEHVRLFDFNVAEIHLSQTTHVQGVTGTKGWMAPEVECNKGFYNPFKADIWSVGKVLEKIGKVRHNFA